MDFKDYYQSLGVPTTATEDDIRKAYRKLARKYHPDVSKEADAQERMRELNEAYEVLKDKEKRAAYDTLAERVARGGSPHGDFHAPPNWGDASHFSGTHRASEADFSEFFTSMFGKQQGHQYPQARTRRTQATRGEDQHARIEITVQEAFQGATRQISLRTLEVGDDQTPRWVNRTLEIKIPKGVRPGQMIRLAGQGLPGTGGPPGDLFLEVALAPDAVFRAEGLDISMQMPVSPSEAALGATIEVPTPAGSTVEVTVPANARAGMKLRLKGRGFTASGETGHLYLVLEIALPPVTDATRAAYESLAAAAPDFNPRRHLGA